jgi:GNAT superfamily N-acetyltransferase
MASEATRVYERRVDDRSLVALGDQSYLEALREQARATGGAIDESTGLLLITGPGRHPIYNYVVRTDPGFDAREAFTRAERHFGALGFGFTVVTMNAFDDSAMGEAALAKGLAALLSPPAMFCTRKLESKPAPPGIRLEPVRDAAGLAAFRDVSKVAWATYGIAEDVTAAIFTNLSMVAAEHITGIVAYDGSMGLSCALVLLSHGIAGVYWVGTAPDGRGRGLGEACTRAVTNIGFDAGARMVTLQASPMGDPIYRRMGYRQIGSYTLYFAMPPRDVAGGGKAHE